MTQTRKEALPIMVQPVIISELLAACQHREPCLGSSDPNFKNIFVAKHVPCLVLQQSQRQSRVP